MEMPVRLAIEYLLASGARTGARLDSLVAHYAAAYGMTPRLAELQADARERLSGRLDG